MFILVVLVGYNVKQNHILVEIMFGFNNSYQNIITDIWSLCTKQPAVFGHQQIKTNNVALKG